jgi:Ca2+-binding EF-hand superfamily protein
MSKIDEHTLENVKIINNNFHEFCKQNNIVCAFTLFNMTDSGYMATLEMVPVLKNPEILDDMVPLERLFYNELLEVWGLMETSFKTGVYNLQRLLEERYSDVKLDVYSSDNEEITT